MLNNIVQSLSVLLIFPVILLSLIFGIWNDDTQMVEIVRILWFKHTHSSLCLKKEKKSKLNRFVRIPHMRSKKKTLVYLLQPCSSLPSSQSALWSHLRTLSIHFCPLAQRNWSKRHLAPEHPSSSRPVRQSRYPSHFLSFGTHGSAE